MITIVMQVEPEDIDYIRNETIRYLFIPNFKSHFYYFQNNDDVLRVYLHPIDLTNYIANAVIISNIVKLEVDKAWDICKDYCGMSHRRYLMKFGNLTHIFVLKIERFIIIDERIKDLDLYDGDTWFSIEELPTYKPPHKEPISLESLNWCESDNISEIPINSQTT